MNAKEFLKDKANITQLFTRREVAGLMEAYASSKMPGEKEMRDKYTDLREKHGLFDAFHHFRIWLQTCKNN